MCCTAVNKCKARQSIWDDCFYALDSLSRGLWNLREWKDKTCDPLLPCCSFPSLRTGRWSPSREQLSCGAEERSWGVQVESTDAGHKREWSCRWQSQKTALGVPVRAQRVQERGLGGCQVWQSCCTEPELHGTPRPCTVGRSYWTGLATPWLNCVLAGREIAAVSCWANQAWFYLWLN